MSLKKLIELHSSKNIAHDLSCEQLHEIGHKVHDEFILDKQSRAHWDVLNDKILDLAKQVWEEKTFPWRGAANVKYPLLTNAVIQFASRVYPQMIQGNSVVHVAVVGDDPTGEIEEIANKISKHMSSQLLVQSDSWETGMDKLLHMYPVIGTVFKKVYYDPVIKRNRTDLCTPETIYINNNIESLKDARRITHILYKHANYIQSMINLGLYCDIDLKELSDDPEMADCRDEDHLHTLLEQHRYLDLDEDGYQEPYIVTIHKMSRKVLRIAPCWDMENVILTDDGKKVVSIKPVRYFVDYHFIPDPQGGFYSLGYGQLLYPINEISNSTLNQLLDSGTLHNMQGGFILKGTRIKNGKIDIQQGQFNILDSPTQDLKSSVMTFPTKEPSHVLLKLLEVMLQAGKDLSSTTDILLGQQSAKDTPATTVLTLIKQGLVVPNAVQKRLYSSMKKEFGMLARLNRLYLDEETNFTFSGKRFNISRKDYENIDIDIQPVADPSAASDELRLARVQAVMQIIQMLPKEGQQAALGLYLKDIQIPDEQIAKLLPPPNPNAPPAPEVQKIMTETEVMKLQVEADFLDKNLDKAKLELDEKRFNLDVIKTMASIEEIKARAIMELSKAEGESASNKMNHYLEVLKLLDTENKTAAAAAKDQLTELDNAEETGLPNNTSPITNSQNNNGGISGMGEQPGDSEVNPPIGPDQTR